MAKVKDLLRKLDDPDVRHVPREENGRADILSKLASTKPGGNNNSLIQETLKTPSIAAATSTLTLDESSSWMTLIIQYLKNKTRPKDPVEAKKMVKEAFLYTIIEDQLYKKGLSKATLDLFHT